MRPPQNPAPPLLPGKRRIRVKLCYAGSPSEFLRLRRLPAVVAVRRWRRSSSSPGEAAFSFTPGRKSADILEESQDERRERITDDDILWPGKTTTIGVRNDEATVFRYTLTLTDLPPSLYAVLPAQGGQWVPAGGVLLQPGEEASFDICFAPPPLDFRTRSQTFSFVITRFIRAAPATPV